MVNGNIYKKKEKENQHVLIKLRKTLISSPTNSGGRVWSKLVLDFYCKLHNLKSKGITYKL